MSALLSEATAPAKGVGQLVLDFDVGGHRPTSAAVSFSGKLELRRQFRKGDGLIVQLVDAAGEVVASTGGEVVAVSFVDKRDKETGAVVETTREHKIKLG